MRAREHPMLSLWLVSLVSVALASVAIPVASEDGLRLVWAVKNQDALTIRALLQQQVDVNTPEPDGATALLWAAQWDDLETAKLLISVGANVSAANDYGVTPLLMACTNGSAAMIEDLLNAGANPNAALPTGETPLMRAALTGRLEAVKALLAHGADVSAREASREQTALMWAVSEKHLDVARTLIEHGADVRGRSASGFSSLMFAARHGELEMVKLLLGHGADVNETASDGISVLHVATVRGHAALVEFLLNQGVDPNLDGAGYTALHWAAGTWESYMTRDYRVESGEWSVLGGLPTLEVKLGLIRALLRKGASVNARLKKNPPRFGATIFSSRLLGGGSLVGATPFLVAALAGDVEVMRLLVAHGADPLLTTSDKTTPLMVAAGLGTSEDETLVPMSTRLDAAKLCVELGADVNAANEAGNTALHATAFLGFDTITQFLVDSGADVNPTNKEGETPLKIAEGFVINAQVYVHDSTAALIRELGGIK